MYFFTCRELLEKELKIKLLELDHEADQLIVPDFYTSQCEEIIRYFIFRLAASPLEASRGI